MSDNRLAYLRATHLLCTHSGTRRGGMITVNKASCSCGVEYGWYGRETEHVAHQDAVAAEYFAAREEKAYRRGAAEALEMAANSIGLPSLFGEPPSFESATQAHLRRLAADYRHEAEDE